MAARFTEVSARVAQASLARRFVPLADSLRDMLTRFGLRQYSVSTVRVRWSGGRRGVGVAEVVESVPLLPVPKVSSLDALSEVVQPVGLDELGNVELSAVSGRYTEEQLRGYREGGAIPPDEEFFYEVTFFPQDGPPQRRRFYPRSPPAYHPGRLQWTVRLEKANEDRDAATGDAE